MTRDDLKSAIEAKRAELTALETEAMTLAFTTDEQTKINFAYDAIMYLYSELGGERQPEQCSNDHRVRFKVISALETRLAAVEATTRMIGEEVFPDELADDEAPIPLYADRVNALDTKHKTKIDNQAATIRNLHSLYERKKALAKTRQGKIEEQAATIAELAMNLRSKTEALERQTKLYTEGFSEWKAMVEKRQREIEEQAVMIAKLTANNRDLTTLLATIASRVEGLDPEHPDKMLGKKWVLAK